MLTVASVAPKVHGILHYGLLGLGMEQGFPSGDSGGLMQVEFTPFGRNQPSLPVLHQEMTLPPGGVRSTLYSPH